MTLDEPTPGVAHRREVAQAKARSHAPPPSTRRDPWRDADEAHTQFLIDEAEERTLQEMHDAGLARLSVERPWLFAGSDAEPAVDARCFPSTGTDAAEGWRSPGERSA